MLRDATHPETHCHIYKRRRIRGVILFNLLKPSVFLRTTRLNIQNFYMVLALR
jgi:hypothetical protein